MLLREKVEETTPPVAEHQHQRLPREFAIARDETQSTSRIRAPDRFRNPASSQSYLGFIFSAMDSRVLATKDRTSTEDLPAASSSTEVTSLILSRASAAMG